MRRSGIVFHAGSEYDPLPRRLPAKIPDYPGKVYKVKEMGVSHEFMEWYLEEKRKQMLGQDSHFGDAPRPHDYRVKADGTLVYQGRDETTAKLMFADYVEISKKATAGFAAGRVVLLFKDSNIISSYDPDEEA